MIPIARPYIGEEEINAVTGVLRSGMLAQGTNVSRFEEEFARYCGVCEAVAVSNGTAALHATLLAFGLTSGDEVIVPDFTFFATVSSVCMCGAKPVFTDVNPRTFNIDPVSLQEKIGRKTKAVIGVHLYGLPFDITPIREICEDAKIPLIEDAAQSHGALYNKTRAGGLGDAGCFSFYPTKNITTGEGGMVTTNNRKLASKIRILINHGQSEKYLHTCLGYNYRMTDIGGALGSVQLSRVESFNASRRENASYYSANIKVRGLLVPMVPPHAFHVYHQYVVKVTEDCAMTRSDLSSYLTKHGIGNAIHYPIPLHKQPAFKEYSGETVCPVSDMLSEQVLSLPVHPSVTRTEREYIVTTLNEVN